MNENELTAMAGRYREILRHAVYLVRSLDAEGQLSTGHVSTLNMVANAPARVSDIARNSGIRVPSATEQVIKLETAGLVERSVDPNDARVVLVALTPAGRAALAEANAFRNGIIAKALAALTDAERAAIDAAIPAIAKLNAALSAQ
ncbi:MarR family winged helix-turn-helix transcriptional regulator [Pseudarthrobacter sp. P1]|uniref:MarR family winged helix-turn-helix transcriptional regulator n=1 Tax=Pseudarthrobacter sp. P1 TaxID=3418418 RepID=UPI003CF78050